MSHDPKSILITGGSRGIGRAVAIACGARGWNVAVNYRADERAAAETTRAVQSAVESDIIDLFEQSLLRLGRLDGVVLNAGIVAPAQPLAEISAERLRHTFEVNTIGAYLCARECARRMPRDRGGGGGSVVIVSSAATRIGSPMEYVDYAGSKAALDTLTIGLAKELGRHEVRVNAVRPGLIETEIHASGGQPDRAQRLGATTPIGRAGHPEEVAEAIVWLLSDASSYVTGAILDVSGGR